MGRVLALDYGKKRTGIAVTDPLQLSINPLDTLKTADLMPFLKAYFIDNEVVALAIGYPTHADGTPTALTVDIEVLIEKCKKLQPNIEISLIDESYTSIQARNNLILMGVKKKERRKKENIDKGSAILILKSYLDQKYII